MVLPSLLANMLEPLNGQSESRGCLKTDVYGYFKSLFTIIWKNIITPLGKKEVWAKRCTILQYTAKQSEVLCSGTHANVQKTWRNENLLPCATKSLKPLFKSTRFLLTIIFYCHKQCHTHGTVMRNKDSWQFKCVFVWERGMIFEDVWTHCSLDTVHCTLLCFAECGWLRIGVQMWTI